ncbi:uncharacterized protein [Aegilops tauschii subsp. strangulata]|uniref:Uncharacterized protein n=1 Tax=Triticum aestivum TaxID=4565 RepID=A0A3B6QHB3_WHEAT|nr:uncharacterized protein LOC109757660 isoform X2 [Aegilops tauschii subsp. strangulata]XP_044419779.1 uncharacterized protein LOC123144643 isoform X2 [Triticum aestivum]
MEQDIPAFKPQWLMQGQVTATGAATLWAAASSRKDCQGKGGSSRNRSSGHNRDQSSRQSSSRRSSVSSGSRRLDRDDMGKTRGYANFGRNKDKEREKDFDSRDRESRSVTADRDGFQSFSSCRPERDRLNRARSKADTSSKGVISLNNGFTSKSNTVGVAFEREFPQLSSEDKNGRQDISRVPSPGITTPIQSLPPFTPSDGWTSKLVGAPLSSEPKKNLVASSVPQAAPSKKPEVALNSGTALSMAETVMQAPQRTSSGPQLSIDAQKIEERTLRQNTLRPMTSTTSKSSIIQVTSSSKSKGTRIGDLAGTSKAIQQSLALPANGSVRAPAKTELSKLTLSGSFKILSREQNCTAQTPKDSPGNPASPPACVASMEPHKKPPLSQKPKVSTHDLPLVQGSSGGVSKSRLKFFQSLRTKSNGSSSAVESGCEPSPSSGVDAKHDSCLNSGMKCMGNGKCFCEEANSSEGSQRHHSDNEENNSSLQSIDMAAGGSQQLVVENLESDSSSELADTGDEGFQVSGSDNADGSSSSALADSDDGYKNSQSGNEEASSSSEATEPEDEEYPAEAIFTAEDLAFMISLGWSKDEKVQPLGLEEIADYVRRHKGLEQRLFSMEANADIKIILLYLCGQS